MDEAALLTGACHSYLAKMALASVPHLDSGMELIQPSSVLSKNRGQSTFRLAASLGRIAAKIRGQSAFSTDRIVREPILITFLRGLRVGKRAQNPLAPFALSLK